MIQVGEEACIKGDIAESLHLHPHLHPHPGNSGEQK